jgi:hydroxyacylglutathione hydrolase
LTTHHHGDHVDGNTKLPAKYNLPVSGSAREPIAGIRTTLREGDTVEAPGIDLRAHSMSP